MTVKELNKIDKINMQWVEKYHHDMVYAKDSNATDKNSWWLAVALKNRRNFGLEIPEEFKVFDILGGK